MKNHEEMLTRQRNNQPTSPFQFDEGKLKNGEAEEKIELGLY